MGFAGDKPHVPGPIKMMFIADKTALAAQLRHGQPALSLTQHARHPLHNRPAG